jgi:hypothetical protein
VAETDELTKAYLEALLEEKRMHPERAAEIDAELARAGASAKPPAKRAAKRSSDGVK